MRSAMGHPRDRPSEESGLVSDCDQAGSLRPQRQVSVEQKKLAVGG